MTIPLLPQLQTLFFVLTLLPVLYILYHHRHHGRHPRRLILDLLPPLGWLYLLAFCMLRVVSGGLAIQSARDGDGDGNDGGNGDGGVGVKIVDAVALGALLLAGVGILGEARRARNLDRKLWVEFAFVGAYQVIVSVAMVVLVLGVNQVYANGNEVGAVARKTQTSTLLKPAMAMLFVCWVFLLAGIVFSMKLPGNALLYAILFILPFIFCKLIYFTLAFFLYDANFATSITIKAILSFVPEVNATVVLLWAGIATRKMWTVRTKEVKEEAAAAAVAVIESKGWYALEDVPERFEGMRS